MKTVYLIPAPDMDERAINSVHIENANIVRINLPRLNLDTDIQEYIGSLKVQVVQENPTLLGFCYGGILAIELSKVVGHEKVIIVSSIKSKDEIAGSRKLCAAFFYYLPDFILAGVGRFLTFVVNTVLGIEVKIPRIWLKNSQNKQIIRHSLRFEGVADNSKIIHIHGENDRVIPLPRDPSIRVIKNAGHFMFVHQRREVLRAISDANLPDLEKTSGKKN